MLHSCDIRLGEYIEMCYIRQGIYMKRVRAEKTRAAVDDLEQLFKALADKTRLRILALLGNNEVCVCHIHDSLGLPQPTVSRHLAYLRKSGLVAARRDGVWMHYQLSRSLSPVIRDVVAAAVVALQQLPATTHDRKQFQRAFGQLYVLDSAAGGACCAPRAHEPQA
jgi:ArsR family transcriptional regulator